MPSQSPRSLGDRVARTDARDDGQPTVAAVADDLRRLSADLVSQLDRANAVLAAFLMAAEHDAMRPADSQPLYWPDLLATISSQVPDPAAFDQRMQAIVNTLHAVHPGI